MPNHQMRYFNVEILLMGEPEPLQSHILSPGPLGAIMSTIKLGLKPSEEDLIRSITVEEAP